MGSVYRARHMKLGRVVALKVIGDALADDPGLRERFRREARAAASIDHPHVVPIFEADERDGRLFLAMRLVEGVDLATLIDQEGRLAPRRAARLVEQIASALDAAHGHGLVHRDVKPGNVLVSASDQRDHAYLTDFGIARREGAGAALTMRGAVVGTLDYLPPEAFRGEVVGPAGDVYALGCVLYEMLAGEVPFPGDTAAAKISAHLLQSPPPLAEGIPEVPEALDRVVSRALAKRPSERYGSARLLALDALAAVEELAATRGGGGDAARGFPPAVAAETDVQMAGRGVDSAPRLNNLPAEPTPLVGRRAEVSAITRRLRGGDARLLTLTGPGGTGKTRLALKVGTELLEVFDDGVVFVDLAKITHARLVLPTVAQSLNVPEAAGHTIAETLAQHLRDKQLLLILDNFEHVLGSAPAVADLLATATRLCVVATSRAPLRLAGEHEFPVPPLSLPDPNCVTATNYRESESVALFLERAEAVRPDFRPAERDARTIADICLRLDGLPLAIELAAARIRVLDPQTLLGRLDQRLKLLTGGPRDAASRHRTLSGAIEWSYSLLDAEHQRLFAHLSVFVGGCTLDAAEALGDPDLDVLDGVTSLVENSLIRRDEGADGEPRFTMLETIREYALDRLEQLPEHDAVRRRHATNVLALAQAAAGARERAQHFDRLEREQGNVRAALDWCRDRGEADLEEGLAAAMSRFWCDRGYLREGRERLEAAVGSGGATGRLLIGLCRVRSMTGGSADATLRDTARAIAICENPRDDIALGEAWNLRGVALAQLGRWSEADTAWQRAITYSDGAGAADEAADARAWRLTYATLGPEPAERGLELCRETLEHAGDNRTLRAYTLVEQAAMEAMGGDFAKARRLLAEGSATLDGLGLRISAAATCQTAFVVEMLAGNPIGAADASQRGYDVLAEMGETAFLSTIASYLARALDAAGRHADVERWTEVAEQASAADDMMSQMLWRTARAKVLARRGETAPAEQLARQGVALARKIESPNALADALMDLAEVLRLAGRSTDVAAVIDEAIRLYDSKGNVVAGARARRQLSAARSTSVRRRPTTS